MAWSPQASLLRLEMESHACHAKTKLRSDLICLGRAMCNAIQLA
jgi:hypothetical protein